MLPFLSLLITIGLVFLIVLGHSRTGGVRMAILVTLIVTSAYMVIFMELLSVFEALTPIPTACVWLFSALGMAMAGFRSGWLKEGWSNLRRSSQDLGWMDWLFLGTIGTGCFVLFLVAIVSPANNYDSLTYHMARVLHWSQNGSLTHYVVANEHQLYMPPLAEMMMLNLRLLWGNDLLAGLVQWTSMVGSLVGVSFIVKTLGYARRYQWVSVAAAFAIPMGILQSTSTQNDYAVSFSVISLAAMVLHGKTNSDSPSLQAVFVGLITGLGLLTKGTFVVYAIPFLFWYFLPLPDKARFRSWLICGVTVAVLALGINTGHWFRNLSTYGGILGSTENLSRYIRFVDSNEAEAPAQQDQNSVDTNGTPVQDNSLFGFFNEWRQKTASMMAWHLITPLGAWNSIWIRFVESQPGWFPPEYMDNIEWAAWNHEDTAGNPVHFILVPLTAAVILVRRKKMQNGFEIQYLFLCMLTFPLLAIVIANSPYLWSIRFQLPFFLLWSPIVGLALGLAVDRRWVVGLCTGGFIVLATPWILFNNTRPVIGLPPWPTRIDSVFTSSKLEILTAFNPNETELYVSLGEVLNGGGCLSVGLQIDSTDPEYLYWWLLDAPQSGVEIEIVDAYDHLARYQDSEFQPCLILCTTCGGRQELNGLHRQWEGGNIVIFGP